MCFNGNYFIRKSFIYNSDENKVLIKIKENKYIDLKQINFTFIQVQLPNIYQGHFVFLLI